MKATRRQLPIESSDWRLGRAVLWLLLALYTATFNGLPAIPDGEVSFQTTSSLWRDGSFALGGTPEAQGLIEFAKSQPPGGFTVREGAGPGAGKHYGWFGVGQAIAGLPFYGAGRLVGHLAPTLQFTHAEHQRYGVSRSEYFEHLFVGWRNPLLSALTAMFIAMMARRFGLSRFAAIVAGLSYGVTTLAWPQSRGFGSEVQGAFLLTWALYLLLGLRGSRGRGRLVGIGVLLGAACLTRLALAPAVLVLNLAVVATLWASLRRASSTALGAGQAEPNPRRLRSLFDLAWPQVLALGLCAWWNWARFGDPLESGYGSALQGGLFGGDPLRALAGLTISPSKGLLWMAPGLLLLGAGWKRARREKQLGFVHLVLWMSVAVFVPALMLRGWHGAWTYGPRYVLPALPGLWVLASLGFQRSDIDLRLRPSAWALIALGFLTQLPGVLVDQATYHELAVQALPERFPELVAEEEAEQAERRFEAMQFDWGFAAPWAHWRLLRHRVAHAQRGQALGESFPVTEIFRFESEARLEPSQARERGYRHLAWVDLSQRLGGSVWPAVALIALLALLGTVRIAGSLDP